MVIDGLWFFVSNCLLLVTAAAPQTWWPTPTPKNPQNNEIPSSSNLINNVQSVSRNPASFPQKMPCICTWKYFCKTSEYGTLEIDTNWACKTEHLICCKALKDTVPVTNVHPSKPKEPSTPGPPQSLIRPNDADEDYVDFDENDVDEYLTTPLAPKRGPTGRPSQLISGSTIPAEISVDEWNKEGEDGETPVLHPTCGVAAPNLEWKNQYNTNDANFGEYPWTLLILIQVKGLNKLLAHCGATLVDAQVAITAAHCVSRKPKELLTVRAGEYDISNEDETLAHQDSLIREVIVHPDYNEEHLENDIAVLVLEKPFKLQQHIKPLCLPTFNQTMTTTCVATGWGGRGHQVTPQQQSIMKKAVLTLVGRQRCKQQLKASSLGDTYELVHTSFCATSDSNGEDTCLGDGGGPLFCKSKEDSRKYLFVGITSWGKCRDPTIPGVYTKVSKFTSWIQDHIEKSYD